MSLRHSAVFRLDNSATRHILPPVSSDSREASQMTGVHPHDGCVRCSFSCRTQLGATLPFRFAPLRFPPLHHQLPRPHQRWPTPRLAWRATWGSGPSRVFGLGIGIFFLSYGGLTNSGAVLAQPRVSARGTVVHTYDPHRDCSTALTAIVHTPAQLHLARFLLRRGRSRVSSQSASSFYLSRWFVHREDRAKATSNFMAAIPVSLVIASPVAGWI